MISTTKNLQLNRGPDNESEHNNRLRQLENRRVKRLPSRMETVNEICVADVHAPRAIENEYYEPVCEPLAPTSGPRSHIRGKKRPETFAAFDRRGQQKFLAQLADKPIKN